MKWHRMRYKKERCILCWHHPRWLIWKFIWFETIPVRSITSTKKSWILSDQARVKLSSWENRPQGRERNWNREMFNIFNMRNGTSFLVHILACSWSWHLCNYPAWNKRWNVRDVAATNFAFKIEKKNLSDDHDSELLVEVNIRDLLREFQLLSRYADQI